MIGFDKATLDEMRRRVKGENKSLMARKCGFDRTVLYDFINGGEPTLENTNKIAQYLGLTPPRMIDVEVERIHLAPGSMEAPVFNHPAPDTTIPDHVKLTEAEVRVAFAMRETTNHTAIIRAAIDLLERSTYTMPDSAATTRKVVAAAIGMLEPFSR